jgi:hypothetical protein
MTHESLGDGFWVFAIFPPPTECLSGHELERTLPEFPDPRKEDDSREVSTRSSKMWSTNEGRARLSSGCVSEWTQERKKQSSVVSVLVPRFLHCPKDLGRMGISTFWCASSHVSNSVEATVRPWERRSVRFSTEVDYGVWDETARNFSLNH